MKYLYDFPGSFNTAYDAQAFCEGFFAEYNHIRRHCGIGRHTPASVHLGTAEAIDAARFVKRTGRLRGATSRMSRCTRVFSDRCSETMCGVVVFRPRAGARSSRSLV